MKNQINKEAQHRTREEYRLLNMKLQDLILCNRSSNKKGRMIIDALCSPQSLVKRVAEYIIGGEVDRHGSPFKRVLNAYSDSRFYDSKTLHRNFMNTS